MNQCQICGVFRKDLTQHIKFYHKWTSNQYKMKFPKYRIRDSFPNPRKGQTKHTDQSILQQSNTLKTTLKKKLSVSA